MRRFTISASLLLLVMPCLLLAGNRLQAMDRGAYQALLDLQQGIVKLYFVVDPLAAWHPMMKQQFFQLHGQSVAIAQQHGVEAEIVEAKWSSEQGGYYRGYNQVMRAEVSRWRDVDVLKILNPRSTRSSTSMPLVSP